jgi:hypothetical protein
MLSLSSLFIVQTNILPAFSVATVSLTAVFI